jgi:proline iminopeptidase
MLRDMTPPFPPVEPHDHGVLDVGDGHRLYWECCGNPAGRPALVLHGGPGSGCTDTHRRHFDPAHWRVVLFDQRGCGRSTPHAGTTVAALSANTTHHLLRDIEALRQHLGIADWLVLGGSWGATLALAYAQRHPGRVTGLVLHAVATTSRREIDWITRGVRVLLPEAWEKLRDGAGGDDILPAYARLLSDPDPAVHDKAARNWCDWEMALLDVHPGHTPSARWSRPEFRLGFARLVTHCWRHGAWLEEDELLRNAPGLAGIPGILVHGRLDIGSPLVTPWQLHRAWPGSELVVLGAAGHDRGDPGMAEAVAEALRRLQRKTRM